MKVKFQISYYKLQITKHVFYTSQIKLDSILFFSDFLQTDNHIDTLVETIYQVYNALLDIKI